MSEDCVTYISDYKYKKKRRGLSSVKFAILLLLIFLAAMIVYMSKIEYFDNGAYRKLKCFSAFQ